MKPGSATSQGWRAPEISIADLAVYPRSALMPESIWRERPRLAGWLKRTSARPAINRAMKVSLN